MGDPTPGRAAAIQVCIDWSNGGDVSRTTWLEQRRPGPDVILLRDYPAGEVVRITCLYCPRAGQYCLARLVERFSPAAGLPEMLAMLSADCTRRQDWHHTGPCGTGFADMGRRVVD